MQLTLMTIGQLITVSWAVIQGLLVMFIQAFTRPKIGEDATKAYTKVQDRMKYVGIASLIIGIIFLISLVVIILTG